MFTILPNNTIRTQSSDSELQTNDQQKNRIQKAIMIYVARF